MDPTKHPLHLLQRLAQHLEIESFYLVAYDADDGKYRGTERERVTYRVPGPEIEKNGRALIEVVAKEGLDLVVSSKVSTKHFDGHLVFFDCAVPKGPRVLEMLVGDHVLNDALFDATGHVLRDFVFFDSGRSYHAYLPQVMIEKAWVGFMHSLLTLPAVDVGVTLEDFRWIGYRLNQGYGALRLSSHNHHYLQEPELVQDSDFDDLPF